MVKPKFHLKVKGSVKVHGKPESKAEATVKRKNMQEKEIQLENAVKWCKDNNKKGHAALQTGLFPLIKDRGTIQRRLDGKVVNLKKEHLRILMPDEEQSNVRYIKNKNRCHQGISKKHVTSLIIDVLKIRNHVNVKVKGGRRFTKLTPNAKRVLETGKYVNYSYVHCHVHSVVNLNMNYHLGDLCSNPLSARQKRTSLFYMK